MIPHLREREKALEPFGWNPEDTEWIAMVCLHSGVFTCSQYMACRVGNWRGGPSGPGLAVSGVSPFVPV